MNVIKRNGKEVAFDAYKIRCAIDSANKEVAPGARISQEELLCIVTKIKNEIIKQGRVLNVEEIQDRVEEALMGASPAVARAYIRYRWDREKARKSNTTDEVMLSLVDCENEVLKQENSNKNSTIIPTQRDYMAGEVSKDLTRRILLPKEIIKAHDEGLIHFHDADYFAQHSHNCDLVNLEDMLQNGTVISGTMIEKPHSFSTACNIATQIIAQVASCQYGGQSITLAHLAPFVNETRKKLTEENKMLLDVMSKEQYEEYVENMVKKDVERGVQTIQYQVVTLMTTNGQAPFITVFMDINEVPEGQVRKDLAYIIEEVLKQRLQGVKNEVGVWVAPAFPKLIYCLDDNNVRPGSEYYYLTELSAKCTAKRLVPDYISAKIMRELKGDVYPCMGCRSFLTPDDKTHKYYGRFNQGVVTINLVDVALSIVAKEKENYEKTGEHWPQGVMQNMFFALLNSRLEKLCYPALMERHRRLLGTVSDVAPILWQYGALARLNKGEVIDELLFNGYSTLSLGYAGLYECTLVITGHSHTDKEGKVFARDVMNALNDACVYWKQKENIDFSLYGTPLESTTYRFAKCLQKRFGRVAGVTDHNYITNSYHVNVREQIDAFSKLQFEAEFQKLSPGGAVSYIEVPNMTNNIRAVLTVIEFIYEHIMYAEINTKADYCMACGYDGEIKIVKDDNDKLVWECPKCKNRDENKMNIARRTCGYIGTHYWNQGRTEEIADRVLHL